MPIKSKGVRNWLDDIMVPTETVEKQFQLLHQTFECLRQGRLSVNLPKSEFLQGSGRVVRNDYRSFRNSTSI